jgi:hypothetical protein
MKELNRNSFLQFFSSTKQCKINIILPSFITYSQNKAIHRQENRSFSQFYIKLFLNKKPLVIKQIFSFDFFLSDSIIVKEGDKTEKESRFDFITTFIDQSKYVLI